MGGGQGVLGGLGHHQEKFRVVSEASRLSQGFVVMGKQPLVEGKAAFLSTGGTDSSWQAVLEGEAG